ncbi:hypothetical protein ACOMHN_063586 [Nucella lapillus]
MKRKLDEDPDQPVKRVYDRVLLEMNGAQNADDVANHFPRFHQVKTTLYRQLWKNRPILPKTLADIVVVPPYTDTNDGRRFLLHDDSVGNGKILVFATDENTQRLCNARNIFMDGTFWVAPSLFHQLFTIHVMEHNVTIPVIYALLPDKTRRTYTRLFKLLQQSAVQQQTVFLPIAASMDFERPCIQPSERSFQLLKYMGVCSTFRSASGERLRNMGSRWNTKRMRT